MRIKIMKKQPEPKNDRVTLNQSDATACSSCESAFARFHEKRRERLIDYIEKRVARHVKSGGNDTPYYRSECAYDGMRDLPQHTDRDIWNAAWKACQENA